MYNAKKDSKQISQQKKVFKFNSLIQKQKIQQILFIQYDMEKRGKKFGTSELRLFRIQAKQNQLYQVDKNNQTKLLPIPTKLKIQSFQQKHEEEWNEKFKQHLTRIKLNFQQRSQIYIYFKDALSCNEVAAYLLFLIKIKSKTYSKNNENIFDATRQKYQNKLCEYIFSKVINAKKYQIKKKHKQEVLHEIQQNLNDKSYVKQLFQQWYKQSLNKSLNSKKQVQLKVKIQSIHTSSGANLNDCNFILKVNGSENFKDQIKTKQNASKINESKENAFVLKSNSNRQAKNKFIDEFKIRLSDDIQFQIKDSSTDVWISQNISVFSLAYGDGQSANGKIIINLSKLQQTNKTQQVLVKFQFLLQKKIKSQKNFKKAITFQHRALIQELVLGENQPNLQFQMEYQKIFNDYQQKNVFIHVSVNKLSKLFQLFKIQGIIDKFYKASPFTSLESSSNITHKGSFIFDFLLKKSNQLKFYDVQKLIWKFKNPSIRNLLNALKSFDQVPKINFTQPFYHLCNRVHQMIHTSIHEKWQNQLFQNSISKADSLSFFVILGIIKLFPSIYIYQKEVQKRSLQYNSLIFLLILKTQMKNIYNKIIKLQLNVQAVFGIQFASLLTRFFLNNNQILFKIFQFQYQKSKVKKMHLFHSIIGTFLALVAEVDRYKFPYLSAESYLLALQYTSNNISNPIEFNKSIENFIQLSIKYSSSSQYAQIMKQLLRIQTKQNLNDDFGVIARQIYEEFALTQIISQRNANLSDIDNHNRKLYLIIDSIVMDESVDKMVIELIQQSHKNIIKLYEHEYKRVNPHSLHQLIEIILQRLQTVKIIIHTKGGSFYCDLDIKKHPSNFYFHRIQNLMILKQLNHIHNTQLSINQTYKNYHISFQFYIKDSSQYQHLQNIIPHQYHNSILYNSQIKKYIIEVRKYLKDCRMRQTNFNLLYNKIGWYGCHYLIPHERILSVVDVNASSIQNNQLNLQYFQLAYYTKCLFGRTMLPKLTQRDSHSKVYCDIIKNQIRQMQNIPTTSSQQSQYNSSKCLISYTLQCFNMDSTESFFQFYVKLCKLPLIQYLLYRPLNFYVLPPICFQIVLFNNLNCTVNMLSFASLLQVNDLRMDYTKTEIQFLQKQFSKIQKEPTFTSTLTLTTQINFYYPQQNLYIDNFMLALKANILHKLIQNHYKHTQNTYFALQKKIKLFQNQPQNQLIYRLQTYESQKIINTETYYLFRYMNQTKTTLKLQLKKYLKRQENILKKHNQIKQFQKWAILQGRHKKIQILCVERKEACEKEYIVQEQITRNIYKLTQETLII